MYRIFCESYKNYIKSFKDDNYRYRIANPLGIIADVKKYQEEKKKDSKEYKQVSDLIYFMEINIERFPKLKAFLWTLSSRDMNSKKYNISKAEDLEEQIKLVNSFLKLAYWY